MNPMIFVTVMCLGVASASVWGPHAPAWGVYGHDAGGLHKYGPAPLGHDGRVVDTAAVAHAKVQHYAAYANAAHENLAGPAHGAWAGPAHGAWAGPAHGAWAGPAYGAWSGAAHGAWAAPAWGGAAHGAWAGPAGPWAGHVALTHDGQYLKDTPEVAHAKAQHLAAKAAASHGGYDHHDW